MTRMARPIAASPAATVRTNMAKTWPTMSPREAEKGTRRRVAGGGRRWSAVPGGRAVPRLAGGDGEDEHGEDLAGHVAEIGGKGDEVDVDREQDELDRHQDDDDVLAVEEYPEHSEHEQDRPDGE